jgi:hemerythrin superfamily protein
MKTTETLTLINDRFTNEEAKDVLLHLFNSPINFYNIKNWSSQERYRKDDAVSQERIPALKKEIEKLQEILKQSKSQNKKLLVSTEITISLADDI